MDITIYAARNQVAHERLLAATLKLAAVIGISENDLDILTRIKAQDNDVHSLYQREAVTNVLEGVVKHLGLDQADESTETTEEAAVEAEAEAVEGEVVDEPAPTPAAAAKSGKSKRKGGAA